MATIVLIDPIHTGHHISYARALAEGLKKEGNVVYAVGHPSWFDTFQNVIDGALPVTIAAGKAKTLAGERAKFAFIRDCMEAARSLSPDIIHFLYLDHYVLAAAVALESQNFEIRGTLHWAYLLPEFSLTPVQKVKNTVERYALRRLIERGMRVMVHSEALRERLMQVMNTQGLDYVPYPVENIALVGRVEARDFVEATTGLTDQFRIVLLFGDLRHDKGADLALQALPLIPDNYHLLIAGYANAKDTSRIKSIVRDLDIANRVHLKLEFISENELPLYFKGSDIVLIPYRKVFAGQSGPMTIAATLGVPVVAADLLVLSEAVNTYSLGVLFESENITDLARAVAAVEHPQEEKTNDVFIDAHSRAVFLSMVNKSYHARSI